MPVSSVTFIGIFVGSAYLIGSLCAGLLVVRLLAQKDIRNVGSGNVGARNAGRAAGPLGFALTLALDFLKGLGVVLAVRYYGLTDAVMGLAALAVVGGHIFSIFLGFSGGKGLATLAGIAAGLAPLTGLGFALALGPFYLLVRSVSLAVLMALVAIPVTAHLAGSSLIVVIALCVAVVTVWWAHRQNITAYTQRAEVELNHG